MTDEDNSKITLQIFSQRLENLVNINHATIGFTVAFFGGVLGIFSDVYFRQASPEKELLLLLVVVFLTVELVAWRIYAHYVDESIIDCYKKIITCQRNLVFSENIRLENDLKQKCGFWNRGHVVLDTIAVLIIPILLFGRNLPLWSVTTIFILVVVFLGYQNYHAVCKINQLRN